MKRISLIVGSALAVVVPAMLIGFDGFIMFGQSMAPTIEMLDRVAIVTASAGLRP